MRQPVARLLRLRWRPRRDDYQAAEQAEHISLDQFRSWNPAVDANCDNLWLGYYVCVGVLPSRQLGIQMDKTGAVGRVGSPTASENMRTDRQSIGTVPR